MLEIKTAWRSWPSILISLGILKEGVTGLPTVPVVPTKCFFGGDHTDQVDLVLTKWIWCQPSEFLVLNCICIFLLQIEWTHLDQDVIYRWNFVNAACH